MIKYFTSAKKPAQTAATLLLGLLSGKTYSSIGPNIIYRWICNDSSYVIKIGDGNFTDISLLGNLNSLIPLLI